LFRLLDELTGCKDDFACPVWPYGRKFFYKEVQFKYFCPSVKISFYPVENVYFIKLPLLEMLFSKLLLKLFKGFLVGFVPKKSNTKVTNWRCYYIIESCQTSEFSQQIVLCFRHWQKEDLNLEQDSLMAFLDACPSREGIYYMQATVGVHTCWFCYECCWIITCSYATHYLFWWSK